MDLGTASLFGLAGSDACWHSYLSTARGPTASTLSARRTAKTYESAANSLTVLRYLGSTSLPCAMWMRDERDVERVLPVQPHEEEVRLAHRQVAQLRVGPRARVRGLVRLRLHGAHREEHWSTVCRCMMYELASMSK